MATKEPFSATDLPSRGQDLTRFDSGQQTTAIFTPQNIAHALMQFVSLVTALIFGVWAIKSFNASQQANDLSESALEQTIIANQLSLISLCGSSPAIGNSSTCSQVILAISLPSIASALRLVPASTAIPPATTTTPTLTTITTQFGGSFTLTSVDGNGLFPRPTLTTVIPVPSVTPAPSTPTPSATPAPTRSPTSSGKKGLPIGAIFGIVIVVSSVIVALQMLWMFYRRIPPYRYKEENSSSTLVGLGSSH